METKNTRKFSSKKITGQGMSEYLVIVGLLAVAGIATMGFMGGSIRNVMTAFATEMSGEDGTGARDEAVSDAGAAGDNARSSLNNYTGSSAKIEAGG